MKDKIRVLIVAVILILLATCIYKLDKESNKEVIETQNFYIEEATEVLSHRKYYILSNEKIEAKATEPKLIIYCKEHVGQTVRLKVKCTYNKIDEEYKNVELISIEEDK